MSKRTRRDFVKTTAALGVGYWAAGGVSLAESTSALEQVNIACIGVGGKGDSDSDNAAEYGNIVAICDCDEARMAAKAAPNPKKKDNHLRFEKSARFTDFRKMFDELGKSIDAVTVSTPDHTHAPASVMAMRLGKHVYCQKPLTHTVYESRLMAQLAKEKKLSTQMGNQGTASDGFRTGVEMIRAGAIGTVKEVHVWTNRPIWPQAPQVMARPDKEDPIPAGLNWDTFIGPAPMRPFVAGVYHPFKWRGWWDFGTGALGDMGCHTMNMAFMALRLTHPTTIEAQAGDVNPETHPSYATIRYEFPANGERPPVTVTWYEGKINDQKNLPPLDLLHGEKPTNSGLLLVGDKGTLYSPDDYGAAQLLLPKQQFEGYQKPEPTLPRNGKGDSGMKAEWIAAMKGGPEPMSHFGYAGLLTETLLLGNVAIRARKKLAWDGPNFKITNDTDANALLHRHYRQGWTL